MKPLNITLVAIHPYRSPQAVPLAAAFLAAAADHRFGDRVHVTILDCYADEPAEKISRAVKETSPDLAGFSVYLWNRHTVITCAKLLESEYPGLHLVCGGPEATADSSGLLSEFHWDAVVRGEGEDPFCELIDKLLTDAAIKSGQVMDACSIHSHELDRLQSPYSSGVIDFSRYSGMLWQLARGCSFGCEFCYDGGGSRTVRRFSMERIEAELKWLVASGVQQVIVLDSTFNMDRSRAVAILKLIRKFAPQIHFHFELRSEFLDRQQAGLFASITCSLQIGLQSGSKRVLQEVGRNFDKADFVTKIGYLNETGAIFGLDLIYGLPKDSYSGFLDSLDFALGLMPNHLDIFPLAVLPGTRLADRTKELGLRYMTDPPYSLISSPEFPEGGMEKGARIARACDIFYSRGKAVAWFMTIAAALKIRPSDLLLRFADHLDAENVSFEPSDQQILDLQLGFIARQFSSKTVKRLLPLAVDLVNYNHHYAAALMAVAPKLPSKKQMAVFNPLESRLILARSAFISEFNHEILEILELEGMELGQMASMLARSGSIAVIYPKGGMVLTESLHPAYSSLLQQLDGNKRTADAAKASGLNASDAEEFLKFAFEEGIVVQANS